jgi:hypothetical protein
MGFQNAGSAAPDSPGSGPHLELSSLGRIDGSESAPKTAPAQADFLLEAIKTLAAEEIRADTLENIPLMLAASGWRSAAALLAHAAGCADAGDLLNAERNRQRAREQIIEANDAFRQFMEARSVEARAKAFAEAFQ